MNKKIKELTNGFSLFELLVTISILGIIVVVGTGLFFSLIKGSTKSEVLGMVKHNGDYALSVMERMIRNSREILECETDHIKIKNPDGGETNFLFCGDPNYLIASESGTLECDDEEIARARIISDEVSLLNGAFTCTAGDEFQPYVVGINFNLTQAEIATRPEEEALVEFKTTVTARNY